MLCNNKEDYIKSSLRALTLARQNWFEHHNNDWDADFFANLFENARKSLECIEENCKIKEEEIQIDGIV